VKNQIKFRLQYPKLSLLACSFLLAYILYMQGFFDLLPELLNGYGYISMFLGGLLFSFGFTTPFAIAIFVEMADTVHPVLGAIIAGLGAVVSDMTIFEFVRFSFMDELRRLKKTAWLKWAKNYLHQESMPERIRQYTAWSVAGILIASPLPDEIGVTLLSGYTELQPRTFAGICFVFNTVGVFAMLIASQTLGS
jgi:hypothetical protein